MRKTRLLILPSLLVLCLLILLPSLCAASGAAVGEYFEDHLYSNPEVTVEAVSVVSGSLPPGLSLVTGQENVWISGTPTTPGEYSFTISVLDEYSHSEEKVSSTIVVVGEEATPEPTDPPPVINQHPSDVTVDEGGSCSFTLKYTYADYCTWVFQSPDGIEYSATEIMTALKGLSVSGDGSYKLSLSGVPVELNGWKVYGILENNDHAVKTERAYLTVKKKATPTPSPTPKATAKATPTPSPAPSPVPYNVSSVTLPKSSQTAAASPVPTAHVHDFSTWNCDEKEHWHLCSCKAESGREAHHFEWKKDEDSITRGTCTVCGAVVRQNKSSDLKKLLTIGLAIAGGLVLLATAIIVLTFVRKKKK